MATTEAANSLGGDPVTNITGYRFVDLPDRDALRALFKEECARLGLKGLILLSTEGMNYFLAGSAAATVAFRALLDGDDPVLAGRLRGIPCKVSYSATVSGEASVPAPSPLSTSAKVAGRVGAR